MCLLILFVLYEVAFVNCLLNGFALSMSVMVVLVVKQMFLFCCVGGFLLNSFAMVLHSVDCVCDEFCQDVVSKCLFGVHIFVCLCDCSE